MTTPLISISIPTYERPDYLKRALDSISIQVQKNFEVIITDDSKSDKIELFVKDFKADFPLFYHKNVPSIGTARNMLAGMQYARSEWIKILHDDDFFASDNAVHELVNACATDARFIFSGYNEYAENTGKYTNRTISQKEFDDLIKDPSVLFARNLIGPPTVLMLHKSVKDIFDTRLKWFTDMEYYFRILGKGEAIYIQQPLVNVSFNDTQVTTYTRTNPSIVIPEAIYLLNKHGSNLTRNIIAYDSWWRVFRNMNIRTMDGIRQYAGGEEIPVFLKHMLRHQRAVPDTLLRIGYISKLAMGISYLLNYKYVNKK